MNNFIGIDAGYSSYERAHEILNGLAYGPTVQLLAGDFGFEGYDGDGLQQNLEQLKEFTNANWDFRGGKERWESGVPELTDGQSDEIFGLSRDVAGYNLVDTTNLEVPVSTITVLGGGNASGLQRIEFAKENIDQLGISPNLYLLGSARPVTDAERAKTDEFSPGAVTEFDLMNSAFERVYNMLPDDAFSETANDEVTEDNGFVLSVSGSGRVGSQEILSPEDREYWEVRSYDMGNFVVRSLLAPQGQESRRANTAGTLLLLRARFGQELRGQKIASSTHAIYSAFQDIDLLRMVGIPLDAQTSTFGFNAEYSGVERQPHQLLQEINSAVNSAVLLGKEAITN